ncbi:MAG: hypothetical protein JNK72_21215 [Myxococcales bacterium]|nr:hypothetical protein [Myxococcales bacterium]
MAVVAAGAGAGCWPSFPENLLQLDVPAADVRRDTGVAQDAVNDLGPVDAGFDAGFDAGPDGAAADGDLDAGLADADAGADAGEDVGEDVVTLPADADVCRDYPLPMNAPSMALFAGLDEPRDLTFDATGRVVVAHGNRITAYARGGAGTALITDAPGTLVAARFTRVGTLVVAYNTTSDAGTTAGNIGVLVPGNNSLTRLPIAIGRVGGLAIDRSDRIWYTDAAAHQVLRVQPNGTDRVTVTTFACNPDAGTITYCSPGLLAFGVGEQAMFISFARSVGQYVGRVALNAVDGGASTVMGTPSVLVDGLPSVAGLAVDECNNVYIADELGERIVRISEMGTGVAPVSRVSGTRGLAFGTGPMFDNRVLFTLSGPNRSVFVTQSITRGNPLF